MAACRLSAAAGSGAARTALPRLLAGLVLPRSTAPGAGLQELQRAPSGPGEVRPSWTGDRTHVPRHIEVGRLLTPGPPGSPMEVFLSQKLRTCEFYEERGGTPRLVCLQR